MNPLAWFAGRAAPQNGQALAFVQALSIEAVLPFTVLAVPAATGLRWRRSARAPMKCGAGLPSGPRAGFTC